PMKENRSGSDNPFAGRDHNPGAFTVWMAGGGVKGGLSYGATDDFGYEAVVDRVHVHDLNATIMHLLRFQHEKFTYFYQGPQYRLLCVPRQGGPRAAGGRGVCVAPRTKGGTANQSRIRLTRDLPRKSSRSAGSNRPSTLPFMV